MNTIVKRSAVLLISVLFSGSLCDAGTHDQRMYVPSAIAKVGGLSASFNPPDPSFDLKMSSGSVQQASPRAVLHFSAKGQARFLFTYAPDGKLVSQVVQSLKSGVWHDSLRTTWTYAANGGKAIEYSEEWLQGAFRPLSRWSTQRDSAGNVTSTLTERGWPLARESRILYGYGANGRYRTALQQDYSNGWIDDVRWSYTLDGEGREVEELLEQWKGGVWDTTQYATMTYTPGTLLKSEYTTRSKSQGVWHGTGYGIMLTDAAGSLHFSEQSYWHDGVLAAVERTTCTFDNAGRVESSLYETLEQGSIVPFRLWSFAYDVRGDLTEELVEGLTSGTWSNLSRQSSTFDAVGNILTCNCELWNGNGWSLYAGTGSTTGGSMYVSDDAGNGVSFSSFARLTFSYEPGVTGVGGNGTDEPNTYELLQNFPNPFNAGTVIHYTLPTPQFAMLQVFDLLGREVAMLVNEPKPAGEHTVRFDAGVRASGMYIYRLTAGPYVLSNKMLLIR